METVHLELSLEDVTQLLLCNEIADHKGGYCMPKDLHETLTFIFKELAGYEFRDYRH